MLGMLQKALCVGKDSLTTLHITESKKIYQLQEGVVIRESEYKWYFPAITLPHTKFRG